MSAKEKLVMYSSFFGLSLFNGAVSTSGYMALTSEMTNRTVRVWKRSWPNFKYYPGKG